MIRALGIDYGSKRIGVAGCDALGITASGIEVIEERKLVRAADRIGEIAREREANLLVIGMPYNMDGSEHASTAKVRRFAELCTKRTGLDVEFVDERMTTLEAERHLKEAGLSRKRIASRIDKVAAAVILQSWLEMRR